MSAFTKKFRANFARSKTRQRGSGAAGVIGLMLGFAFVWWTVSKIAGCIYETQLERNIKTEETLAKYGIPTPTPISEVREFAGYTAECSGVLSKQCKQVFPTPTVEEE